MLIILHRSVGADIVTFYVGPDKVQIGVHSKILFKQVPVFRNMFTGGWQETASRTADLPEDDLVTFQRFVNFLYFGKIGILNPKRQTDTDSDDWDYMRLYAFAHKYCFDSLMEYALSRLFMYYETANIDMCFWVPDVEIMIFMSRNTSAECALQRYMNKCFLRRLNWNCMYSDDELRQLSKECPETLFYIGTYIRDKYIPDDLPEEEDEEALCANYHLHDEKVACPVPKPENDYLI